MKKFALFIVVLIAGSLIFAANIDYQTVIDEYSGLFSEFVGQDSTIAFVSLNSDSESFANRFMTDLETALINGDCLVAERRNIDKVVDELKFQTSGLVDDNGAVSVGHMVGANYIITGECKNMSSSYYISLSLTDVETGLVRRHKDFNIKYDSFVKNLVADHVGIGSQKFSMTVRIGDAVEVNKAHKDLVGSDAPKEESTSSFVFALSAGYEFAYSLSANLDFVYFANNGLIASGTIVPISAIYKTVDIPVYVSWSFIETPVKVFAKAGLYCSLPVSKVDFSISEGSSSYDLEGIVFGAMAGIGVEYRLGPGLIDCDIRYISDFNSLKLVGDFGEGLQNYGLCFRKGIVVSAGYSFAL